MSELERLEQRFAAWQRAHPLLPDSEWVYYERLLAAREAAP